jgi:hypothetical protein
MLIRHRGKSGQVKISYGSERIDLCAKTKLRLDNIHPGYVCLGSRKRSGLYEQHFSLDLTEKSGIPETLGCKRCVGCLRFGS